MENRYIRNMKAISKEENEKLKDFRVCVIGCGGLGGYIIEMLGRLGIGYITVVDKDVFDESNLNRQILSDEITLGKSKSQSAKDRMKIVNSQIKINAISEDVNENNTIKIIENHHIVIDALDNIKARFLLQEACEKLKIPLVHGAISGWYGQVSTILPGDKTLDYVYKNKENEFNNELGNPSFTPANIASIQVSEVIKVLLNKGDILSNKLLLVDLLYNEYNVIDIVK